MNKFINLIKLDFFCISIYSKYIYIMEISSININFPINDDVEKHRFLSMNRLTKDKYYSDLLLLLLTEKGSRYYNPEYGTNLYKYIFEPNDNITENIIVDDIKNTVSSYMPEISIKNVKFNWIDESNNQISDNQLNIHIDFIYGEGGLNEMGNIDINF